MVMDGEKVYKSSTGINGFHYGIIGDGTTAEEVHRVKFLQEITVEHPQEIVRAHGDNVTAEMAVSSGDGTVNSQFHKIPLQDKVRLLGWEVSDGGLVGAGSEDNPPYVAVVFFKTHEDGSTEYVGLPKAMFTRPAISGSTKGESTEFSSEEIAAQFMDREVDGFSKQRSIIVGYDESGDTTDRDAIFQAIFGKTNPTENEEGEGA